MAGPSRCSRRRSAAPCGFGSHLAVVAVGSVVLLAVTGLVTGAGAALVVGDAELIWQLTVAHLNQAPAVWVTKPFGSFPANRWGGSTTHTRAACAYT